MAVRIYLLLLFASVGFSATAQVIPPNQINTFGGVMIDAEGVVHYREIDAKALEQARSKARLSFKPGDLKIETLAYVSLPRVFEQARALLAEGKPIPDELKYLGGMTSLKYVFVFPEEHDLVIAGPAEPIDTRCALEPFGKKTGRPVMQLDDLVVAMRTARGRGNQGTFGCSIDPSADSLEKSAKVMRDYANASRAERMKAMGEALGPQKVTIFGTQENTRIAFTCVAADYKLKRISLGIDSVPGVGNSVDNTRQASSRVWFEVMYDPMLVSPDGDTFEIRGQRLQLKAGGQPFDPRGATEKVTQFAKQFTKSMPQLCASVSLFADLQNIADLSLLANLIQSDQLDLRTGWDAQWLFDAKAFPVAVVPVSQSAETLVAFTSGSICAGGVGMTLSPIVQKSNRQSGEAVTAGKSLFNKVRTNRGPDARTSPIIYGP